MDKTFVGKAYATLYALELIGFHGPSVVFKVLIFGNVFIFSVGVVAVFVVIVNLNGPVVESAQSTLSPGPRDGQIA